jgi:hypothetical protein
MKTSWITCTLVATCALLTAACSSYVEYVPVELRVDKGDHRLVENPALLTPRHIDAMKRILDEYGKSHKTINGRLYIKASLQQDKDLLQNFTAKARASEP